MPEAAAPAAAPMPNGSTSQATPAPSAPQPQGKPTPGKGAAPRSTDGKFLPKESSSGVAKEAEAPDAAKEAVKEAYRFKRKLKVFGEEQDFDLDEDGLAREVQLGRAAQRREKEVTEQLAALKQAIVAAKEHPDEFLKQLGHDPEEFARQRILQALKLEQMSESERALLEMQQKYAALEAEHKKRLSDEKAAKDAIFKKQLREGRIAKYTEALKAAGLDAEYENIYLMAETERLARGDGDKPAIELSPEELAKETTRRMSKFVENYLGKLDARSLMKKLGEARVREICDAVIADYEGATASPVPTRKPSPPPEPTREEPHFLDIRDVERKLKKKYGF